MYVQLLTRARIPLSLSLYNVRLLTDEEAIYIRSLSLSAARRRPRATLFFIYLLYTKMTLWYINIVDAGD